MSGPDAPDGAAGTTLPDVPASLGAQAVWLLAAKVAGFALALGLPLLLVRRLSQEEFGLYKQVFLIVGTSVNVLPLGFGMSAFYFLPRELDRQGSVVINILIFHTMVGVTVAAIMALWPDALALMFNNPELARLAPWIALVVLLWTVGSFLEIIPVAMQDVRASMGFIVTSQFSKTMLLLLAAVIMGSVWALIVAAAIQGALQIALMLAYLRLRFPGFLRAFDWRLLRAQAVYALPVGASSLLLKLQDDIHHAFVSNAFGPAAYAIYAVGVFKLPLIGILREAVGSVALPRINQLEAQNSRRQILGLVAASARKLALAYFPVYALMMVVGRDVISVLFTSQYVDSWPVFAIALTTVPLNIIMLDPVTRANDQRFYILQVRVVLFVTLVVVLTLFSAQLGLTGVIAAVVAANVSGWAVAVRRMAQLLGMTRHDWPKFAAVGQTAVAAAVAAFVTALVRSAIAGWAPAPALLLCLPVFGLVYFAAIARAGVLPKSEIRTIVGELRQAVVARRLPSRRPAPAAPPVRRAPVEGSTP